MRKPIDKPTMAKGAILLLALALVLVLRFLIIPGDQAGAIIIQSAYYLLSLNLIIFLITLVKSGMIRIPGKTVREHLPGILLCLGLAVLTQALEPHRFRIMQDEFALLNNSMSMHLYNKAALSGTALLADGHIEHSAFTADKRSLLFQYLVSLLHTFTGYRPANAFALNFLVTGAFYLFLYGLLWRFTRDRILSSSGLVLACALPLLHQVATSGGYDLLNVTLILLLIHVALAYANSPSTGRQSVFVMTALLLGQVRYESILYLLALAMIVFMVWIRNAEIRLSWISAISPAFLFLPLMANAHMFSSDLLQDSHVRAAGEPFMSMQYLVPNLERAAEYFFTPHSPSTNSIAIAVLGLAGIGFLFVKVWRQRKTKWTLLATVLTIAIVNFLIMASNFWGILTDYKATRFALPLYILGLVSGMILLGHLINGKKGRLIVLLLSASLISASGLPRAYQAEVTEKMSDANYHRWILEFATEKGMEGKILFTCDGTLGLIAHGHSAIPLEAVNYYPGYLIEQFKLGIYEKIYAFDLQAYNEKSGQWVAAPGETNLDQNVYAVEVVAEIPLIDRLRGRAYRITGVYSDVPTVNPPGNGHVSPGH